MPDRARILRLSTGRRGFRGSFRLAGVVPAPTPKDPTPAPQTAGPLLATGGATVGPGGGSAFVGHGGNLLLAYHAGDAGATAYPTSTSCRTLPAGCGQRRLHVARLTVAADGSPVVASRG